MEEILTIIKKVQPYFIDEPTLLEVPVPLVIVGDIHGQYMGK